MKKVEQVDIDGNIFLDYDTSLSPKALFDSISRSFPAIFKDEDGMICGEIKGRRYAIRAKNITYLGHPHPLFKKRIQISGDLRDFYFAAKTKGREPILLGVYTCGSNTVFCDFNIEDFINKKAHNSSAHVYTSDIAEATQEGYFYKEDYFGNKITVFSPLAVTAFLEEKMQEDVGEAKVDYAAYYNASLDSKVAEEQFALNPSKSGMQTDVAVNFDIGSEINRVEKVVMEFFSQEARRWDGIECYKRMIAANYRNKYQPEWPGFYLEYEFERYLNRNNLSSIIRYAQDKSKGGIDLDLFFPTLEMYGDLKAHSSSSKAIQGNDWGTVFSLIDAPDRDNHIYYIVCEHDTEKDSDYEYEVTYFWNTAQGKENLLSYSKKMKNHVVLTHAYMFDINATNKQYLTKFKQGLNSNGKPRAPKIMIEQDNYSHFILAESVL